MTVYIIVAYQEMIESVWTDKKAAELAIREHAADSGYPLDYYKIVERKVNQLHAVAKEETE